MSFQCRDAESIAHGERFDDVIRQVLQHPCARLRKLVAIGVNCTEPKHVAPLLRLANRVNAKEAWPKLAHFRPLPYVVYPNGGGLSVGTWQDATDGASFVSRKAANYSG
jgi:S-methylmethionine-dependent homocysteine/selenocysteine methylase